ncbi:MAG TPA: pyrimidine 5'-nucleotidase [Alphaproteobacteria bacterium]|jgi:putative hydrolase of the HAD superfamily|nr:pyrimidine 5'-nucleotidase [Alphaproteobacteria bacterium]
MNPGISPAGPAAPQGLSGLLDRVDSWVFDLDNTLYPASSNLFVQVDQRMKAYIGTLFGVDRDEAHRIQKSLFLAYGTTMRGLMTEHGVDPRQFLDFVHAIDHSQLEPNPALGAALARLPGRKYIFTNASTDHADRVLARLGIAEHFMGTFDIVAADFLPKPNPECYEQMLKAHGIEAGRSAMFDDIPKNLEPAAALGMTTVWIRTDSDYAKVGEPGAHIHYVADDITLWLTDLMAGRPGA